MWSSNTRNQKTERRIFLSGRWTLCKCLLLNRTLSHLDTRWYVICISKMMNVPGGNPEQFVGRRKGYHDMEVGLDSWHKELREVNVLVGMFSLHGWHQGLDRTFHTYVFTIVVIFHDVTFITWPLMVHNDQRHFTTPVKLFENKYNNFVRRNEKRPWKSIIHS